MVFGAERKAPYVIGQIDGNTIIVNFGDNDRILFLLMGAALAEIQCFEFSVQKSYPLSSRLGLRRGG
jgi:hypothetical protein